MSDEIELRVAWAAVAGRGPSPPGRAAEVFDDVVGRHREAHRRYHGLRHVVWIVRHVHELATATATATATDARAVDLERALAAAFFHDAVYDPAASDNEERSAVLAARQLATLRWTDADIEAVAADIRATAGHIAPGDVDAELVDVTRAVLLDADLAVLGSDAAAYQAYATGVRAEYAHVDDDAWRAGRGAVLRTLLDRPRLYVTDAAVQRWDAAARANLAAELASLG